MTMPYESRPHVYGQGAWQDDVIIVGSTTALSMLRDALGRALNQSGTHTIRVSAGGGEGYAVQVVRCDNPKIWKKRVLPYTDDIARESEEDEAILPWRHQDALKAGIARNESNRTLRVGREILEGYCKRGASGRITIDVRSGKTIWMKPVETDKRMPDGFPDEIRLIHELVTRLFVTT